MVDFNTTTSFRRSVRHVMTEVRILTLSESQTEIGGFKETKL